VSRYVVRLGGSGNGGKRWLSFLKNHREMVAAMDFSTVPTITFRVLYCFFVISHGCRKILHFDATEHPTSADRAATSGGFPGRRCTSLPDP
jgi:hypothetical protein